MGGSKAQISEAARIISTHKNDLASVTTLLCTMLSDKDDDIVPFNLLILWAIIVIVESGVHFEIDGDIHSALVLPDNPELVADGIEFGDKLFRRKAGKTIEASFGEDSANLGQPLKKTVVLQIRQHWGCKGHKAQPDCPHNKIDNSPCNLQFLVVMPTWLLCDRDSVTYDRDAVTLPDLNSLMRMSDFYPFLIDKEEREKASSERKTKPKTDVRGQAKRFAERAETNVDALPLLSLLMAVQQCVVTKLMGNDAQFATFSYEVVKAQDCSPAMRNSLAEIHSPLVHAQGIAAATVQLEKFEDDHLHFMDNTIVKVFSKVIGLPPDFASNMLMKRSGRSNMTDVQKQLIRENSALKQWLDKATPEQLSDRAKKGNETLGRAGRVKRSKKGAETLGRAGRVKRSKKAAETLGRAGRVKRSKKGAETLGRAGRVKRSKKGAETLGKDGLINRSKKAHETMGKDGIEKKNKKAGETKRKRNPLYNHFTETESGWSCNYCPSVIKRNTSLKKHLLECKSCPLLVKNILKTTSMQKRG